MAAKAKKTAEMVIPRLQRSSIDICLLGRTPLVMHSMNSKTQRALLLPPARKTAADKKTTLKSDPFPEFRRAAYTHDDKRTLFHMPSRVFKKAICGVAVDIPNAPTKAALNRTIWVPGETVPVYGIPQIDLRPIRNADQNKTPGLRARPLFRQWAVKLTVEFTPPLASAESIVSLVANAGMINGIGEDRPSKGGGNWGCWEVVNPDNKEFKNLLLRGRKRQVAAFDDPDPSNDETHDLLMWFFDEASRRDFRPEMYPKIEAALQAAA